MAVIGVEVSLTRGLDLDRDLDLLRLGVLELEDVGGGFVGVAGEPARNLRFISSMACSVGCMLARGLDLASLGLSVRLSRAGAGLRCRYVRRVEGLSSSSSGLLSLV